MLSFPERFLLTLSPSNNPPPTNPTNNPNPPTPPTKQDLKSTLQEYVRLQFTSRGADDRAMLAALPTTLKRRVLRHEYGDVLSKCAILRGTNPKFLDALLCAATIETYMPRVDMLADGGERWFRWLFWGRWRGRVSCAFQLVSSFT